MKKIKLMKGIYKVSENIILIIIAHRLSMLESCEKIYGIEDRNIGKNNLVFIGVKG